LSTGDFSWQALFRDAERGCQRRCTDGARPTLAAGIQEREPFYDFGGMGLGQVVVVIRDNLLQERFDVERGIFGGGGIVFGPSFSQSHSRGVEGG